MLDPSQMRIIRIATKLKAPGQQTIYDMLVTFPDDVAPPHEQNTGNGSPIAPHSVQQSETDNSPNVASAYEGREPANIGIPPVREPLPSGDLPPGFRLVPGRNNRRRRDAPPQNQSPLDGILLGERYITSVRVSDEALVFPTPTAATLHSYKKHVGFETVKWFLGLTAQRILELRSLSGGDLTHALMDNPLKQKWHYPSPTASAAVINGFLQRTVLPTVPPQTVGQAENPTVVTENGIQPSPTNINALRR